MEHSTCGHSGGSQERSEDQALDFLSPEFCPEQALASSPSKLRLPCPHVQPCDNLDTYVSIMKGTVRPPVTPMPSRAAQLAEDENKSEPAKRQNRIKSVLTVMASPQSGPLSLVQQCYNHGGRVRVLVRHCAGVRGECVGTLLAFDKHLNLVLGDVTEEYCPFCTVSNGGLVPRARRRRRRRKKAMAAATRGGGEGGGSEGQLARDKGGGEDLEKEGEWVAEQPERGETQTQLQRRQLRKLFIRGDNIVLITPVSPEQPP